MDSARLKIHATYSINDTDIQPQLPKEVIKRGDDVFPLSVSPHAFSEFIYSLAWSRRQESKINKITVLEHWPDIDNDIRKIMDTVEEVSHHDKILSFGAALYAEERYFSASLIKGRIRYQEFDYLPEWVV